MTSTLYSVDTSALLDGWVRHYPPAHFPSLWDQVEGLIDEGRLRVSEEVLHEVARHEDSLNQWLQDRRSRVVVPTTNEVTEAVREILRSHERLVMSGSGRNRADPFVIAVAGLNDAVVVTGERGGTAARPKIPSVCRDLGIRDINLLDLIKEEGWVFR